MRPLTPYFSPRQVFTGAGRLGIGQESRAAAFQLSQRADFFEVEVGLETTLKRPIINTRDEPHADPERFRRLHVIVGDANLSDTATFLKMGATAIVLSMIEDGVFGCVTQTGEQGGNVGKAACLLAGWSPGLSAVTINRYCASGLSAVSNVDGSGGRDDSFIGLSNWTIDDHTKGMIDEDHPLSLGCIERACRQVQRKFLRTADLIVGLGYDTAEVEYEAWIGDTPLLQIDIEQADLAPSVRLAHQVTGDLESSLQRIAALAPARPAQSEVNPRVVARQITGAPLVDSDLPATAGLDRDRGADRRGLARVGFHVRRARRPFVVVLRRQCQRPDRASASLQQNHDDLLRKQSLGIS